MALSYLALALALAFSLNAANRFVRASGTLLAALALVMLVVSIVMADFDGTFSGMAPAASRLDPFKPLILNIQATVAAAAAVFLFWASWLQLKRHSIKAAPPLNTASTFGLLSRSAHWITATLILCLIPMGLFVSVLKAGSPDRAEFLAAHQSLGLAVLGVAGLRLLWLLVSPPPAPPAGSPPWGHRLARAVHIGLYGLILAFPVSGFLASALEASQSSSLDGPCHPPWPRPNTPRHFGWRPTTCSAVPLLRFDFCACGRGLEASCPGWPQGRHSPHAGVGHARRRAQAPTQKPEALLARVLGHDEARRSCARPLLRGGGENGAPPKPDLVHFKKRPLRIQRLSRFLKSLERFMGCLVECDPAFLEGRFQGCPGLLPGLDVCFQPGFCSVCVSLQTA